MIYLDSWWGHPSRCFMLLQGTVSSEKKRGSFQKNYTSVLGKKEPQKPWLYQVEYAFLDFIFWEVKSYCKYKYLYNAWKPFGNKYHNTILDTQTIYRIRQLPSNVLCVALWNDHNTKSGIKYSTFFPFFF